MNLETYQAAQWRNCRWSQVHQQTRTLASVCNVPAEMQARCAISRVEGQAGKKVGWKRYSGTSLCGEKAWSRNPRIPPVRVIQTEHLTIRDILIKFQSQSIQDTKSFFSCIKKQMLINRNSSQDLFLRLFYFLGFFWYQHSTWARMINL